MNVNLRGATFPVFIFKILVVLPLQTLTVHGVKTTQSSVFFGLEVSICTLQKKDVLYKMSLGITNASTLL